MNAFNTVNLGAACIVTSTEFAKQLHVPEDKWIYPRKPSRTVNAELLANKISQSVVPDLESVTFVSIPFTDSQASF